MKAMIQKRRIFQLLLAASFVVIDFFILILSLFAFSALALVFQLFTRKHSLQI